MTSYGSQDSFRLVGDTTYQWYNYQLSGQYNKQINERLKSRWTVGSSLYGYRLINADSLTESELSFRIQTSTLKGNFKHDLDAHLLTGGIDINLYQIQPGTQQPRNSISRIEPFSLDHQVSLENGFIWKTHGGEQQTFNSGGLRLPLFVNYGEAKIYEYAEGALVLFLP